MSSQGLSMDEEKTEVFLKKDDPYCPADKISKTEGLYTKRIVRVLGQLQKRHMFKCNAMLRRRRIEVYMDLITGSCYDVETGVCFSSSNLQMIVPKKRERK